MRKAMADGQLVLAAWGEEMRYVNRELGRLSDELSLVWHAKKAPQKWSESTIAFRETLHYNS
jgi:hypothetical protein